MKVLGLAELANIRGIDKRKLYRQLVAVESVTGLRLLIRERPGTKWWINMDAVESVRAKPLEDIEESLRNIYSVLVHSGQF